MRRVLALAVCLMLAACTEQRAVTPEKSGAASSAVAPAAAVPETAAPAAAVTPSAAPAAVPAAAPAATGTAPTGQTSATASSSAPASASAGSASASTSANVLACDWPGFAKTTSLKRLNELFGKANIKTIVEGEGFTTAVVYPGNPQRELQLKVFNDAEFSGASVDSAASAWTLPGGVGMGTVLDDVQRANGRPFSIDVFAGGATSSDWQGGALGSGGCNYFANFQHGDKTIKTPYKILSDDPAIRALGLKVARFGLNCSNC